MIEKDWVLSSFNKRFHHYWWAVTHNKDQKWIYRLPDLTQCIWEIITEVLERVWAAVGSQIDQEAILEAQYKEPISAQIIHLFLSLADITLN